MHANTSTCSVAVRDMGLLTLKGSDGFSKGFWRGGGKGGGWVRIAAKYFLNANYFSIIGP